MKADAHDGLGVVDLRPARVVQGTTWSAVDRWTQQIGQLLTFLIVGNIVGAEVFGQMGMALVFALFVHAFLVDGFAESIIQRLTIDREHLEAAFWTLAALGLFAAAAAFLAAPLVAALFEQTVLIDVIHWISLTFVVVGISSLLESYLRRTLSFRALALRSALAYGVAAPVTIALAAAGYGIWSLVANQLILRSVEIAVLLALCGWLPRPTVSASHIRDLLSFGTHSIGFRAVSYFSMQIDRLLIGAVLGAVDLGHYAMARRIVDGGVYTLTGFMNTVALSAFSPLQGHDDKLAAALIAATRLASIIVFPALIGLAIVAPLVVGLLLTPEWDPAALIIQILAFHGLFLSMVMFLISVVRAKGQSGTTLIITMVGAALNVAACVGAVSFGIESVAIATVVVDLIVFPIWFHRAARLIPLTVGAYVGSFVPAAVSTVCMTGSVLLAEYLLQSVATTGVRLAAAIATGVIVYGLVVSIVARPALVEIARLMRKR